MKRKFPLLTQKTSFHFANTQALVLFIINKEAIDDLTWSEFKKNPSFYFPCEKQIHDICEELGLSIDDLTGINKNKNGIRETDLVEFDATKLPAGLGGYTRNTYVEVKDIIGTHLPEDADHYISHEICNIYEF